MREYTTARVISTLLSLPFVAAAAVIALASGGPFPSQPYITTWQTVVMGLFMLSVAPIAAVLYMHWKKQLELDVPDRRKRPIFFFPALLAYLLSAVIFSRAGHRGMYVLSIAYFLVCFIHLAITFAWKISLHSAGLAGPITALVFTYGVWLLPLYTLMIPLMWARLRLRAHTLGQAFAGAFMATLVTAAVYVAFS